MTRANEKQRLLAQKKALEAKYGLLTDDAECPEEVLRHIREVIRFAKTPTESQELGYP